MLLIEIDYIRSRNTALFVYNGTHLPHYFENQITERKKTMTTKQSSAEQRNQKRPTQWLSIAVLRQSSLLLLRSETCSLNWQLLNWNGKAELIWEEIVSTRVHQTIRLLDRHFGHARDVTDFFVCLLVIGRLGRHVDGGCSD